MRGQRFKSVMAENLMATNAYLRNEGIKNTRYKLCWKCQKDKSPIGGHLRAVPGLMKFICADCMAAKKTVRETDNATVQR